MNTKMAVPRKAPGPVPVPPRKYSDPEERKMQRKSPVDATVRVLSTFFNTSCMEMYVLMERVTYFSKMDNCTKITSAFFWRLPPHVRAKVMFIVSTVVGTTLFLALFEALFRLNSYLLEHKEHAFSLSYAMAYLVSILWQHALNRVLLSPRFLKPTYSTPPLASSYPHSHSHSLSQTLPQHQSGSAAVAHPSNVTITLPFSSSSSSTTSTVSSTGVPIAFSASANLSSSSSSSSSSSVSASSSASSASSTSTASSLSVQVPSSSLILLIPTTSPTPSSLPSSSSSLTSSSLTLPPTNTSTSRSPRMPVYPSSSSLPNTHLVLDLQKDNARTAITDDKRHNTNNNQGQPYISQNTTSTRQHLPNDKSDTIMTFSSPPPPLSVTVLPPSAFPSPASSLSPPLTLTLSSSVSRSQSYPLKGQLTTVSPNQIEMYRRTHYHTHHNHHTEEDGQHQENSEEDSPYCQSLLRAYAIYSASLAVMTVVGFMFMALGLPARLVACLTLLLSGLLNYHLVNSCTDVGPPKHRSYSPLKRSLAKLGGKLSRRLSGGKTLDRDRVQHPGLAGNINNNSNSSNYHNHNHEDEGIAVVSDVRLKKHTPKQATRNFITNNNPWQAAKHTTLRWAPNASHLSLISPLPTTHTHRRASLGPLII